MTMTVRTRELAVSRDAKFDFDGTTSDLAQQYYMRHLAGEKVDPLPYTTADIPEVVAVRVQGQGLAFENLPPLLQRALIWDSGYAFDTKGELVRVWTDGGRPMNDIALSKDDYDKTTCKSVACPQPNGVEYSKATTCTGKLVVPVLRCATVDFTPTERSTASIWSAGGDNSLLPVSTVLAHSSVDPTNSTRTFVVHSIHTLPVANPEPDAGSCPAGSAYGSIVIPCYPYSFLDELMRSKMRPPRSGRLVASWLLDFRQQSEASGFNMILLVPIITGVLVLLGGGWWFWRRKQNKNLPPKMPGVDPHSLMNPFDPYHNGAHGSGGYNSNPHSNPAFYQPHPYHQPPPPGYAPGPYPPQPGYVHSNSQQFVGTFNSSEAGMSAYASVDEFGSQSSSSVMQALFNDPNLATKRLAFERIQFTDLLSKGAFGEVWKAQYDGQDIAVKRLLQSRKQSFEDVRDFTSEIQLTASLQHPNMVRFIGVAWNSLENLVMVLEYLPMGDLQTYLKKNPETLSWDPEKLWIAMGVGRAIGYMHSRTPSLIHRDLKAKNVMITEDFDAKIIDFGTSRRKKDDGMTAGVGTPFWTAPEVLEGTVYTEQSDIYSFGVMLSELDSCKIPYSDVVGPRGEKLQPVQILELVIRGKLRPTFSDECPERIRTIAEACLQKDPTMRPTASELVKMLTETLDDE